MKQVEALGHVAHSGGSLYLHSGWRGHKFLVCREDQTTIGMPMLERLLQRVDLELVANAFTNWDSYATLTDQGKARL